MILCKSADDGHYWFDYDIVAFTVYTRDGLFVPIFYPKLVAAGGSGDTSLKTNFYLIAIEIGLALFVTAHNVIVQAFRPCCGGIVEHIWFRGQIGRGRRLGDDGIR